MVKEISVWLEKTKALGFWDSLANFIKVIHYYYFSHFYPYQAQLAQLSIRKNLWKQVNKKPGIYIKILEQVSKEAIYDIAISLV